MEQSVWTSLPMARAIEHMLPNSPFAANAAVAKPSKCSVRAPNPNSPGSSDEPGAVSYSRSVIFPSGEQGILGFPNVMCGGSHGLEPHSRKLETARRQGQGEVGLTHR